MRLLRHNDYPDGYFTLACAGYDDIRARGGNAGPMKGGRSVIAFVEDPDGYKIELIQKKNRVSAGGSK